jgi:hypothetical protein
MSKETRVRRMVRGSPVGVRHGPWRVGCQRYRLNHNRKVESSRQMVQIESASPPPTHCTAPTGPDSWPNTGEPELGRQSHGEESGSEGRERGCGGKEKQTKGHEGNGKYLENGCSGRHADFNPINGEFNHVASRHHPSCIPFTHASEKVVCM